MKRTPKKNGRPVKLPRVLIHSCGDPTPDGTCKCVDTVTFYAAEKMVAAGDAEWIQRRKVFSRTGATAHDFRAISVLNSKWPLWQPVRTISASDMKAAYLDGNAHEARRIEEYGASLKRELLAWVVPFRAGPEGSFHGGTE